MTQGFYTITYIPHEGAYIAEHSTKADALKSYNADMHKVKIDADGKPAESSILLGAALVHIEITSEKGYWHE